MGFFKKDNVWRYENKKGGNMKKEIVSETKITPQAEKAIVNPVAGKTLSLNNVVYQREKLSIKANDLIEELIAVQKQRQTVINLAMNLEGVEQYITKKIGEEIK